jgi:hypothetical protein
MMIRKILSLCLAAALILPAIGFAEPVNLDFSEHTPVNAGLRSLLLPGWGQFFNAEETKGYVVAGGALITVLTSYLLYSKANKTYEDYEELGVKNSSLYSDYETQSNQALIASVIAVGVWAYGAVDAYLSADKIPSTSIGSIESEESRNDDGIHMACNAQDIGLVYTKRF